MSVRIEKAYYTLTPGMLLYRVYVVDVKAAQLFCECIEVIFLKIYLADFAAPAQFTAFPIYKLSPAFRSLKAQSACKSHIGTEIYSLAQSQHIFIKFYRPFHVGHY